MSRSKRPPQAKTRRPASKVGATARRDSLGLPTGKDLTPAQIEELRRVAREYQFVVFGTYQLAAIIGLSPEVLAAVAQHRDSPFLRTQKKARPEWVLAFLKSPPSDFAVG